ncbi:flagellar biosynthesis protein FlhF [Sphaerotilus sp.]|uniref:flagellar biosynthesis protein FlhF n=1 Tax=Sphaerotilus sp. TaxID=2093942 RepID=UPI002ACE300D|nr:flagellar biosynthesis protein FlhF [Sphaerotilus sp.]MDZ7856122.1 flagellar biosynthesis protein FlhF [Sphaerotilus sp.]
MNVKRFFGRNSREAMQKVRQTFGDNAVILSTKPSSDGVEVVAMPSESIEALDRHDAPPAAPAPQPAPPAPQPSRPAPRSLAAASAPPAAAAAAPRAPAVPEPPSTPVQDDVGTLAMSTLSFQDYVRERMLKKRKAELSGREGAEASESDARAAAAESRAAPRADLRHDARRDPPSARSAPLSEPSYGDWSLPPDSARMSAPAPAPVSPGAEEGSIRPFLLSPSAPVRSSAAARPAAFAAPPADTRSVAVDEGFDDEPEIASSPAADADMLAEIRSMKSLIEERFTMMAFMDRLQKSPRQVQLSTRLLECGFSPALVREIVDGMPGDEADEMGAVADLLQRNLLTSEDEADLEDEGGVYALIGSTGVGKTTSTAKLATAFATRHGPSQLGLITLDAYRVGAHEQLRAYGRILGVPVHTAHDRAAMEDLLDLLSGKKMVLIDTAGLAQRDARTRDLLDMLTHRSIKRLLVVNAAQQAETIEDVITAYKANQAKGIILSKLDEAVKLGPALDAMIRHRLKVLAVATGQRVPEDWHHLNSQTLVQRALRGSASQAWRMSPGDVSMAFARPGATTGPVLRRSAYTSRDLGA